MKCTHQNGPLVVKVFIKPDPGLSLRTYARRLKGQANRFSVLASAKKETFWYLVEREALADIPNVYNYKIFVENDRAGYIVRQWLDGNLYDRIRYAHVSVARVILCIRRYPFLVPALF